MSLAATAALADSEMAKLFRGTVYVESYDQVMVVAIDTNRDGLMDAAFVAATADSFTAPVSYRWQQADVVFKPSGIMITAAQEHEALIATFRRDIPRATFAAPAGFHTTRIDNLIGLAHHSSLAYDYPMEEMPSGRGAKAGRVASDLYQENGWTKQPFQQDWESNGGGGGCTSGGGGAPSCSISGCVTSTGRNDCAVSCMTGYYACCNCGSCICLRYDGRN